MTEKIYDVVIIGGGINGCAIAAELSMRGLNVVLCEQNDLASGTSSMSSKLIHGGLRYLEDYDFKLVKHALKEREILLRRAPHLVRPLEFILPYSEQNRPYWMIRLGLWIYDWLAPKSIYHLKSNAIYLNQHSSHSVLKPRYKKAFTYFDGITDDARLVIANAQLAKLHGAEILPYRRVVHTQRDENVWHIRVENQHTQKQKTLSAKLMINATGPWHNLFLTNQQIETKNTIMLLQGSHIVVKKHYEGNHAYLLQASDKRVLFAIPFEKDYLLIGTTEKNFAGDPTNCKISEDEIDYLLKEIQIYWQKPISAQDIVWSYSGVRPLIAEHKDSFSQLSRDFHISLDHPENKAPYIDLIGGKITTHRYLATCVAEKISSLFVNLKKAPQEIPYLPGGDLNTKNFRAFLKLMHQTYAWLPQDLLNRYAHQYGSKIHLLLENSTNLQDLGEHFGHGLYQTEIEYLITYEWAYHVDDILFRRTKLGLKFNKEQNETLYLFLKSIFESENTV